MPDHKIFVSRRLEKMQQGHGIPTPRNSYQVTLIQRHPLPQIRCQLIVQNPVSFRSQPPLTARYNPTGLGLAVNPCSVSLVSGPFTEFQHSYFPA